MSRNDNELEYSPRQPFLKRRIGPKFYILAAIVFVLLTAPKWGPIVRRHFQILWWQHQAVLSQPKEGTIIYSGSSTANGNFPTNIAWQNYYALLSPPGAVKYPIPLIAYCRDRMNEEKLVEVEAVPRAVYVDIYIRVIKPTTFANDSHQWFSLNRSSPFPDDPKTVLSTSPNLLVKAGAVDLTDPSHCFFDFTFRGRPFRCNIWLGGLDIVKAEFDEPLTPPAPPSPALSH